MDNLKKNQESEAEREGGGELPLGGGLTTRVTARIDAITGDIVGAVASDNQQHNLPKREKSITQSQEPETEQPMASRESTAGVSQGRRRKRQTSNRESFRRPAWDVSGGDRQNINHPDYRLVRGQEVPAGFRRRPTEHEMEAEVLPDKPPGYGWGTLEKRGKAEAQAAQVARRQKHAPIHERGALGARRWF